MCWGDGLRGERIPAPLPPPATLPALGNWADRGRPSVGLRHAPSASALFAFKSPELGEGRIAGNPGQGPNWTLCFGVNRSSASVSLCPGGPKQWTLIQMACPAGVPARSLSWEGSSDPGRAQQALALLRAPPRFRRNPPTLPARSLLPPRPRLKAPQGRSLMRPETCPAPLSPRAGVS